MAMNPQLPIDKILAGDCREVLAGLPEGSVDVVFADPPYNLQLQQDLYRPNLTRVDAVDDSWDQFASFAEYDRFTREWLSACRRVLKDSGTLWVIGSYHNIFRVGAVLQDLGYWILNDVVWVKTNPMPNFRGVRFTNAHETLIWAQKERGRRYTFNHAAMKALNEDLQMRSDWRLPICTGKERLRVNGSKAHATQKPESLLYRVILASTRPGDVVLDPFFGSGTSGAVAKKLGRHWIGIEQDASYVQLASQRIAAVEPVPESSLELPNGRKGQSRLPFGALLEHSLLQPGQVLTFGKQGQTQALVLADGRLRVGDLTGSIHQLAHRLAQAPCNGWEQWFFDDPSSGERQPIDVLRQELRRKLGEQMPDAAGRMPSEAERKNGSES